MARRKTKRRGRPAKKTMDERIKDALAEAKRLSKMQDALDEARVKLEMELYDMASAMRNMEENKVTDDDLDNAATSVSDADFGSVICYLEGKHGC